MMNDVLCSAKAEQMFIEIESCKNTYLKFNLDCCDATEDGCEYYNICNFKKLKDWVEE